MGRGFSQAKILNILTHLSTPGVHCHNTTVSDYRGALLGLIYAELQTEVALYPLLLK